MKHIINDGGRAAAGFKGSTGDCVTRAVAIASGVPYKQVYDRLADGHGSQRLSKRQKRKLSLRYPAGTPFRKIKDRRTAPEGIYTQRKWFRDYMREIGFDWVPCMTIGSGCKVHLREGELPMGRLVVNVSRHSRCHPRHLR
jgi:hypothetical protein